MSHRLEDVYRWIRSHIPRKPKHIDRLIAARRARFAHILGAPAKRLSFRRYWRDRRSMRALEGIPRAQRRRVVLQWWRDQKHSGETP